MADKGSVSLSIIIVNWNAGQQLRDCISAIASARREGFILSEVVVVDNGSTDDSLERIKRTGVPVRVIRNAENRGFAAACNQGVGEGGADYLLFLNPDTRVFEDSLNKPVRFMQQPESSGVGVCGIQLVDDAGNAGISAARFPTLRIMAGAILGLTKLFPSVFPAHLMTTSDLRMSRPVDQVTGAFFLVRRSVFERCGGFDERFFVYFEEVDLSLRAKQLGYSSYFLSDVSAFHKGGGCSDRAKAARSFYSLRSRILYARKHYSKMEFVVLIFLTGLELPLRLARSVLRVSWSDMINTLSAYTRLVAYFVRRT